MVRSDGTLIYKSGAARCRYTHSIPIELHCTAQHCTTVGAVHLLAGPLLSSLSLLSRASVRFCWARQKEAYRPLSRMHTCLRAGLSPTTNRLTTPAPPAPGKTRRRTAGWDQNADIVAGFHTWGSRPVGEQRVARRCAEVNCRGGRPRASQPSTQLSSYQRRIQ